MGGVRTGNGVFLTVDMDEERRLLLLVDVFALGRLLGGAGFHDCCG